MKLLIEHGANVDTRNISRKIPLHLTAMFASYDAKGIEIKLRKRGQRIAMGDIRLTTGRPPLLNLDSAAIKGCQVGVYEVFYYRIYSKIILSHSKVVYEVRDITNNKEK